MCAPKTRSVSVCTAALLVPLLVWGCVLVETADARSLRIEGTKSPDAAQVTTESLPNGPRVQLEAAEGELDSVLRVDTMRYVDAMPAAVARNGQDAAAFLLQQLGQVPSATVSELSEHFDALRLRRSRDEAYQWLRRTDMPVVPVGIDRYLRESDAKARRDILVLVAEHCNKDNYEAPIAFLQRECFRRDDRARADAINALGLIMKGGVGRGAWLPDEAFGAGIQFLARLANSEGNPYPNWQWVAGRYLYRLGRADLIPADMREVFYNRPE